MRFTRLDSAWNALTRIIDRVVGAPVAIEIGPGTAITRCWQEGVGTYAVYAALARARAEAAIANVVRTARHVFGTSAAARRRVGDAVTVRVITRDAGVDRSRLDATGPPQRVGLAQLLAERAVAERADARSYVTGGALAAVADGRDAHGGSAAWRLRHPHTSRVVAPLRHSRSVTSRLPRKAPAASSRRGHADRRIAAARRKLLPLPVVRAPAWRLPVATDFARQTLKTAPAEASPGQLARGTWDVGAALTNRRARVSITLDDPAQACVHARAVFAERAVRAGGALKPPIRLARPHLPLFTARRCDVRVAFETGAIRTAHRTRPTLV
jgi:hypothetical protein